MAIYTAGFAEWTAEQFFGELKQRQVDQLIDVRLNNVSQLAGFAKEPEHNWEILKNIERFQLLGYPLLIGASRKRFLGELVNAKETDDREAASIALTAELARLNVWGVRTHSVKPHRDAISVIDRLRK